MVQAQALERQGRSREACMVLERALAKDPEQIGWMRLLAYWLFRDGRELELLPMLQNGPDSYGRDAYLVYQEASCLARVQRFGQARRLYRRVLELTQDTNLRRQALGDLAWLEEEEATETAVKSGLTRARLGVLAGSLALAGGALFLWFARRREDVKGAVDDPQRLSVDDLD
jgi:Flp pilus assembly protein TadD